MGKRRWTPGLEDDIRRTTFAGQIDIEGSVATREFVAPPPPAPPADPPKPDYVYAPGEQPELFE